MPRHIMHQLCLFQQYGVARTQLKNCSGVVHGETLFWLLFVTTLLQIISLFLPSSSPVSQVTYAVRTAVLATSLPSIQRSQFCLLFLLMIHRKGGPSSWQPCPSLLNLMPTFPVLLSQSCRVNHTVGLHYLFPDELAC